MGDLRRIDTDMASLMKAMHLEPKKNSVVMVDVETNNPKAGSVKDLRIFDYGYGDFNPFTGNKGNIMSNIVYEGIINPKIINQISEWNKIKNAGANEYYGLFNMLKEQNWWSDKVLSKSKIQNKVTKLLVKERLQQELYELQTVTLPEFHRVLKGWETERAHYKDAPRFRRERQLDINKTNATINKFKMWLNDEKHLDAMIKANNYTKNTQYDDIMNKIYNEVYREQYENIREEDYRADQMLFRQVEQKVGVNFSQNIKRWGEIIHKFDSDLQNNKNLLGVTAYNIQHEQNAIKKMNQAFGVPTEIGNLSSDRYRTICMNNMIGMLRNKGALEILNGLNTYDKDYFDKGLAEALNKEGKLHTMTFEQLYNHLIKGEKYTQSHTAKGDVLDQMDVFTEAVQKYLKKELEGGGR